MQQFTDRWMPYNRSILHFMQIFVNAANSQRINLLFVHWINFHFKLICLFSISNNGPFVSKWVQLTYFHQIRIHFQRIVTVYLWCRRLFTSILLQDSCNKRTFSSSPFFTFFVGLLFLFKSCFLFDIFSSGYNFGCFLYQI